MATGGIGGLIAATMAARGYTPAGPVVQTRADGATLFVQRGACAGVSELCQTLFIYLNDTFLGTDWPEPSLGIIDVRPAGNNRFTATYATYHEGDAAGRPSGPPVAITFTLSGSGLRPDGIAPGQCQNGC